MIYVITACWVIGWYHALAFDWKADLDETKVQRLIERQDFKALGGRVYGIE